VSARTVTRTVRRRRCAPGSQNAMAGQSGHLIAASSRIDYRARRVRGQGRNAARIAGKPWTIGPARIFRDLAGLPSAGRVHQVIKTPRVIAGTCLLTYLPVLLTGRGSAITFLTRPCSAAICARCDSPPVPGEREHGRRPAGTPARQPSRQIPRPTMGQQTGAASWPRRRRRIRHRSFRRQAHDRSRRRVTDQDFFDYVIIGAGSARCVLAARLTEDPAASLLLEPGPPADADEIRIPAAFASLFKTPAPTAPRRVGRHPPRRPAHPLPVHRVRPGASARTASTGRQRHRAGA
jgi:hypothetical protein